jgi:hypothetical protein
MDETAYLIDLQDRIDEGDVSAVLTYIDNMCSRKYRSIGAFCRIIGGAVVKFNKHVDNIPQQTLQLLAAMGYYDMPIKRRAIIKLAADIMFNNPSRPRGKQFILMVLFTIHKLVELFDDYCAYFRIEKRDLTQIMQQKNVHIDRTFYFTNESDKNSSKIKYHLKNSPTIFFYNLDKFGFCQDRYSGIADAWFTYILGWCVAANDDILYDISIVTRYEPLLSVRVINIPNLEIIGQIAYYSPYIDEQTAKYENINNLLGVYLLDRILYITLLNSTIMVDIDTMDVVNEVMNMEHGRGPNKLIPLSNSFYYVKLNKKYKLLTYKSDEAWPPSKAVKTILPFYNIRIFCKTDQSLDSMEEIACQIESLDLR